jgi:salicylate hydroxylase
VKVRHDEGVANRIGPEPCAGAREGLRLYEAQRLPCTARVQALAANDKTRFHLPDGPEQVARDSEMSKSVTDFSLHSVAWLYGHDATQIGEG